MFYISGIAFFKKRHFSGLKTTFLCSNIPIFLHCGADDGFGTTFFGFLGKFHLKMTYRTYVFNYPLIFLAPVQKRNQRNLAIKSSYCLLHSWTTHVLKSWNIHQNISFFYRILGAIQVKLYATYEGGLSYGGRKSKNILFCNLCMPLLIMRLSTTFFVHVALRESYHASATHFLHACVIFLLYSSIWR